MGSYVSAELRRFVAERADHLCEYCLVHEDDRGFGCQVDHIISEKHGGLTEESNLATPALHAIARKEATWVLSKKKWGLSFVFIIRTSTNGTSTSGSMVRRS